MDEYRKTNIRLCDVGVTCILLSRILTEVWEPRLWAGLATVFFIWFALQMSKNGFGYAIKIISFALAMVTVQPLQNWIWQTQTTTQSAVENMPVSQVKFKQIKNTEELDRTLAEKSAFNCYVGFIRGLVCCL